MIYFTKHSEEKFEVLNKHQVFITREQIEDAVKIPDKTNKKGKYTKAIKENVAVIYHQINGVKRIITFFPIQQT